MLLVGKQVDSHVRQSARPQPTKPLNCRLFLRLSLRLSVDPRFLSWELALVRNDSQSILERLFLNGYRFFLRAEW